MNGNIIVKIDADLKEIIPEFLKNRRQDIASIEAGLKEKNYEAIRVLGHSMKGSGASYGFHFISEIGKAIEDGAKAKSDRVLVQKKIELINFLDKLRVEFIPDSGE